MLPPPLFDRAFARLPRTIVRAIYCRDALVVCEKILPSMSPVCAEMGENRCRSQCAYLLEQVRVQTTGNDLHVGSDRDIFLQLESRLRAKRKHEAKDDMRLRAKEAYRRVNLGRRANLSHYVHCSTA